ncbi:hypothetical protein [Lentibacillus salinarum]|uniref:Uncharacterized protein n=1 Tax=Lentibacillus salinarum TaxID=446820 RepID=A0ABW3ZZZ6_9BACI
MKQLLVTLFFGLIVSFGIVGYTQTISDANDVVEQQEDDSLSDDVIILK